MFSGEGALEVTATAASAMLMVTTAVIMVIATIVAEPASELVPSSHEGIEEGVEDRNPTAHAAGFFHARVLCYDL